MYISPTRTPAVKARQEVECRILLSTIDELLEQGFILSIFDGEEDQEPTTEREAIIKAAYETDEDYLNVYRTIEGGIIGWIRFVYGNDGWDVISDYTTNMTEFLPKTLAVAGQLGDV